MAEIGRWGGHKFEVSSAIVRGFESLTIKGSSETEDKESGGVKYVSRKNGKPAEVTMTIRLNATLGCNVRDEAMGLVNEAIAGKKDYFYIANKKLVTCQLMLVDASVKEIGMTNNGTWTRANVAITMKQCTKNDGSTGGGSSGGSSGGGSSSGSSGGGGSKKTSVKTSSITSAVVGAVTGVVTAVKNTVTKVKNALTGATSTASSFIKKTVAAVNAVKKVSTTAKKASTTAKKVSGVVKNVKNLLK